MATLSSFQTPLPTQAFQLDLPARAILTLPDAAGIGIECRSGSVWVTLDHDPRDIVLSAGERFEAGVHRRALVLALASSSITVSHAQPAAWPSPAPAQAGAEPKRQPLSQAWLPA